MNKKLLLIGIIIAGFAIGQAYAASGDMVTWFGFTWFTSYGTTTSTNSELHIVTENIGSDTNPNYRGGILYSPTTQLQTPWYKFTFNEPIDSVSVQIFFLGANGDYLWFEVNHQTYSYLAKDQYGYEYAGSFPMPAELWGKPSHEVSFALRPDTGYVDLWLDSWKRTTIRDPYLATGALLQNAVDIDVISLTQGQEAVFTNYVIEDNYVYSGSAPSITSLDYTPSVDEGPSPATVSLTTHFEDNEGWDTFTATIDWGDGTVENIPLSSIDFTPIYSTLSGTGAITGSHTYPNNGLYDGVITVTDEEGLSDSSSFQITVNEVAPSVDFQWSAVQTGAGYDVVVTPDVQTSPDSLDHNEWLIDSETTPTVSYDDTPITFSFTDTNDHDITLTTYDSDGSSATTTQTVNPVFPVAELLSITPAEPNEGDPVIITVGINDGFTIKSVNWVIDGTPVNNAGASIIHTFADNGTYSFTATIKTNEGGSSSVSGTILVADVPTTVSIANPASPVILPIGNELNIIWQITDPGDDAPWTYQWLDNNGGDQHDYNILGAIVPGQSYTSKLLLLNPDLTSVTLVLTDKDGYSCSETMEITLDSTPMLTLTGPATVNVNQNAKFTAEITSPGTDYVTKLEWNIAGITSSTNPSTTTNTKTVTIPTPGTYTATATITTFWGETQTESLDFTVVEIPVAVTPLDMKNEAYTMLSDTRADMESKLDAFGKKGKTIEKAFDAALNYIEDSVNSKYWSPDGNYLDSKDGKKVFDAEKHAVDKIQSVIKAWAREYPDDPLIQQWTDVIQKLVGADKTIAENDLALAMELAGDNPAKNIARHLDRSQSFIDKAAEVDLSRNPSHAINLYKSAWQQSQAAQKKI